jgi:tol-pal system protein YbgF
MVRLRSMCAMLFVAGGCTNAGPSDAAFKKLTEEVNTLRASQVAMAERLNLLESQPTSTAVEAPIVEDASPRASLQVVKLTPDAGGASPAPSDDPESPAERVVIRMNAKGVVVAESTKIDPNLGKSEFERARRLFDEKDYDKALGAFAAFVTKFPDSSRIADATYFRGLCYAKKADWSRAKDQFLSAVSVAPKGDTAPSALYDLIGAYEKLGEPEAAAKTKARLLAEFPSSKAAKRL